MINMQVKYLPSRYNGTFSHSSNVLLLVSVKDIWF